MIKKQDQQIDKYRKMAQEAKKAGSETEKGSQRSTGMLDRVGRKVTDVVVGFGTLTSVVRGVGDAMRFSQEQSDKAVESMTKLIDARRRLNQVSLSDADLDALDRRADELSPRHGVNRLATRGVLFASRSEEAITNKVAEHIVRYSPVVDPYASMKVAGQVPSCLVEGCRQRRQCRARWLRLGVFVPRLEARCSLVVLESCLSGPLNSVVGRALA